MKKFHVETINGGAAIGAKLAFADYENVSPHFSGSVGVREVNSGEEHVERYYGKEMTEEEIKEEMAELQRIAREVCEANIDEDIADVKGKKVFAEILKLKSKKK